MKVLDVYRSAIRCNVFRDCPGVIVHRVVHDDHLEVVCRHGLALKCV
jgi:hypothetical protein